MADDASAEFNLRDLNDEELTEQVHDDLYNGLKAEVEEATRLFLERGWSAEKVLNDALVEGMRIVGIDFRDGIRASNSSDCGSMPSFSAWSVSPSTAGALPMRVSS